MKQLNDQSGIKEIFHEMLDNIKEETSSYMKDFNEFMDRGLSSIRVASDPILCRIKRAMHTQTFQSRKADIETQYNKADLPKGKFGRK